MFNQSIYVPVTAFRAVPRFITEQEQAINYTYSTGNSKAIKETWTQTLKANKNVKGEK